MADEDNGIGFLYSGWCQAALPHRRLPDDKEWQIRSDHVNMLVQPGLRTSNFGDAEKIGVPYGSRARLIMFYVQSEAPVICLDARHAGAVLLGAAQQIRPPRRAWIG
jgi:hypothetical protein